MPDTLGKREEKSAAPALAKGFAILELVAQEPGLSFAGIRTRLGLPNSSCHHLVSTLCRLGALHLQANRGYVLGLKLFELGTAAAGQRHLEEAALDELRRLAHEVQLTCNLGVLEGTEAVYLLKVESDNQIRVNTWVGKRLSLHCSSLGKVLLAWLPENELERILDTLTWERRMPSTITDRAKFRLHLEGVRRAGWALDDEEDLHNIRCVAAPVRDMNDHVIAAVSAVGTVLDIGPERFEPLAERVGETARAISRNLGHR